jgi:hypothetical protein
MCPSATGLVVGNYVHFWKGFDVRQLCTFKKGDLWYAVMYPSCRGLVVGSYVPF